MLPGSRNRSAITKHEILAAGERDLLLRARAIQSIRRFFIERGYLEVETPNLIPAPAPEVHIDAISAGRGFMHTSPELCMKRLLAAGYSRIFQICRCFRDGERGDLHLPEFTLLEWYCSGIDYTAVMEECEEMIRSVARELGFGDRIDYQGRMIDLEGPWERITVRKAFERYSPISMEEALELDRFDEIMVEEIEPGLNTDRPVFLYDFPASLAALARLKEDDPDLAERFELYMGGLELANAFSELSDVHEQTKRFEAARISRKRLGKREYPLPDNFLNELRQMPLSAGIALGVDRFVMLFANAARIDNVVSFTPEEL